MSPEDSMHVVVPLDEWAKELVSHALAEHLENCPVRERVRRLELRFIALVGLMLGSGALGGLVGGLFSARITL
ncbi:MAG TPA: hypothetical protein VMW48_18905 [Vicinamibacterales bacterium]|nr:hypothetical protein [Vicinamibacterales bacterium]